MFITDLVLELAVVLTVLVVLLAIPRMVSADREQLKTLHRQQVLHRHKRRQPRVQPIQSHPAEEHHPTDRPVRHAA